MREIRFLTRHRGANDRVRACAHAMIAILNATGRAANARRWRRRLAKTADHHEAGIASGIARNLSVAAAIHAPAVHLAQRILADVIARHLVESATRHTDVSLWRESWVADTAARRQAVRPASGADAVHDPETAEAARVAGNLGGVAALPAQAASDAQARIAAVRARHLHVATTDVAIAVRIRLETGIASPLTRRIALGAARHANAVQRDRGRFARAAFEMTVETTRCHLLRVGTAARLVGFRATRETAVGLHIARPRAAHLDHERRSRRIQRAARRPFGGARVRAVATNLTGVAARLHANVVLRANTTRCASVAVSAFSAR